jgi:hypothetical protein
MVRKLKILIIINLKGKYIELQLELKHFEDNIIYSNVYLGKEKVVLPFFNIHPN